MPTHRYSFSCIVTNGLEKQVQDLVGNANARLMGGLIGVQGIGVINLEHHYLQLPRGIISSLASTTIMAWITWRGVAEEQSVFDFGNGKLHPDSMTYFALATGDKNGKGPFAAITKSGPDAEGSITLPDNFPRATEQLLAVVVDEPQGKLLLYMNDKMIGAKPITTKLREIRDERNYLAKGQKGAHTFRGSYNEFRIYDQALTLTQIAELYKKGPDVL